MSETDTLQKTTALELREIAKRINGRVEGIEMLKTRTIDSAHATLTEAILQGQDLIKAKAIVPHGLWLDWLAANCPRVKKSQAETYMRLAHNPTAGNLMQAGSIKAALRLLEDAKPKPAKAGEQGDGSTDYLEGLDRILKWSKFVRDHPLDTWPPEGIDKARQDLEPTARLLWPERFNIGA